MKGKTIKDEYFKLVDHYYDVLLSSENPTEELNLIIDLTKSISISLYSISKSENLHWNFCSFRTYTNTYIDRLNKYLDENEDDGKNEGDFIKSELSCFHFLLNSEYLIFIDDSILQKVKEQLGEKIQFLTYKIGPEKVVQKKKTIDMFTSEEAEELFNRYTEEVKDSKYILTEMSFIYWKMYSEGHINEYVRPEMFKKEISKPPLNIFIEHSLKSLKDVEKKGRKSTYNSLKRLIFNKI